MNMPPDFRSESFLRAHIAQTMAFYHPRCIDRAGGFFHYFRDDGTVYDRSHRHLVSSTRFVFNYAMAAREFTEDDVLRAEYLDAVQHGLAYLRDAHRNPSTVAMHGRSATAASKTRPTTATASRSCCSRIRLR